jgi:hypothetical protein
LIDDQIREVRKLLEATISRNGSYNGDRNHPINDIEILTLNYFNRQFRDSDSV